MKTRPLFNLLPLLLTLACSPALLAAEPTKGALPASIEKIFVVILENTNYADAIRQPYLAQLVKQGALLENFFAETHPSLPNYLALVSGNTHGVTSDANFDLKGPTLVDLLEKKGKSWKVYAEDFPGDCFPGAVSKQYVRKHNPLMSFDSVRKNPGRCAKIVPASVYTQDLLNKSLPDFSLYIPGQDNDGHDTGVGFADGWLSKKFEKLLKDPAFLKKMLFVVTFDEDSYKSNNRIYTVLLGEQIKPGARSGTRYDHYSLLRTIEDLWHLGSLDQEDAKAQPITGIWKSP